MKRFEHSPAYVAELRGAWRVVVPIRGRLAPDICTEKFTTQTGAVLWLQSHDGQEAVSLKRASRRSAQVARSRPHHCQVVTA